MKKSLSLRAPAKLNLFLEVLKRRRDGYHLLQTVFQEISLFDSVKISRRSGARKDRCRSVGASLPSGRNNLALAALEEFRAVRPLPHCSLTLTKRIPLGAGLGGGSSDAAAVLKGAWLLSGGKPGGEMVRRLTPVARRLGADVAFFLQGGLAMGTGLGDRVRPLRPRKGGARGAWFVLIFPGVSVSTASVYKGLRFPLTNPRSLPTLTRKLRRRVSPRLWAPDLFNRLERGVFSRFRAVREARDALEEAGCLVVRMSGSGSTVYGVASSGASARRVRRKVVRRGWKVWVVRSVG